MTDNNAATTPANAFVLPRRGTRLNTRAVTAHFWDIVGCVGDDHRTTGGQRAQTVHAPSSGPRVQRTALPELPELGSCVEGRYTLRQIIGLGGMACVYEAQHEALDKTVAVKVLLPQFAGKDSAGAARFLTEARAASKIRHRGVVELSDFGHTDEGLPYFVMECLDGDPLDVVLQDRGALPLEEALALIEQILDVLSVAHDAGVIHRDIKPGNCMLTSEGLKLLDFGIAQVRDAEPASRLTGEGNAIGTPHYMAPEQALGKRVDARADLYTCAILLFELLTGAPPFDNGSPVTLLTRHITEPAPPLPPRDIDSSLIPDAVRLAVERALAKSPDDRFSTAQEFRTALRQAPPSVAAAAPHRTKVAFLVGALVLGGVGIGGLIARPSPSRASAMLDELPSLAPAPSTPIPAPPKPEPTPFVPQAALPKLDIGADEEPPAPRPRKRAARKPKLQGQLESLIAPCSSFGSPGGQPLRLSVQVAQDGELSSAIVNPPYAGTPLGRCAARSLNDGSVRPPAAAMVFRGSLRLRSEGSE